MGKTVIIKGANFSENAIELQYVYNYSDSFFEVAERTWANRTGYAIVDEQDALALRHKILKGVRMNISQAGSMAIYKCSNLDGGLDALTYLCTIQTDVPGIQNLLFGTVITLNDGEYLVFGTPGENFNLLPKFRSSGVTNQPFAYDVGLGGATTQQAGNLCIDFLY